MDFYLKDNEIVRGNCVDYIQNLPPHKKWHVKIVEDKKSLTYRQRNYWHELIGIVCKFTGGDTEDLKMDIKFARLPLNERMINGKLREYPPSTESITREQYSDLIESTVKIAHDLNLAIPQPKYFGMEI